MNIDMILNGRNIRSLHLTPLQGTIDALLKPAQHKKMPSNDNSSIDGSIMYTSPSLRRLQSNNISLKFLFGVFNDISELQYETENLVSILVNGYQSTGVNTLTITQLGKTYHLVYDSISTYQNFGQSREAIITIKFIEPNPNNR